VGVVERPIRVRLDDAPDGAARFEVVGRAVDQVRVQRRPELCAPTGLAAEQLGELGSDVAHCARQTRDVAQLEVLQADVTRLDVDAIANAANTRLLHGGGVAGAISRAGGPEVQRESDAKAPIALGEAVETTAGDMPARWVIHAATMELGGPTSAAIIEQATRSTLAKAEELGCRS